MIDAISLLKGDGSVEPAHQGFPLTGTFQGAERTESVAWWLANADSTTILTVLSKSPHIVAGQPGNSDFYTTYLSLSGRMGQRWNISARRDPSRTYIDIVRAWIEEGCPLPTTTIVRQEVSDLDEFPLLNLEAVQRREILRTAAVKPTERRRFNPYGMHAVH